jgi:hypothetical protein
MSFLIYPFKAEIRGAVCCPNAASKANNVVEIRRHLGGLLELMDGQLFVPFEKATRLDEEKNIK